MNADLIDKKMNWYGIMRDLRNPLKMEYLFLQKYNNGNLCCNKKQEKLSW